MLLERTKRLVINSPFTEKFKSGTITKGELEELYGMYGKIYFQGSDKQKLDFWAMPVNGYFTKTDAIIDFVLYMGPSMSDEILRSIIKQLIAIEQEYSTTHKLVFMRQASLAKYFLAYEAFRLKDQDVCAFYFPAKESSSCKDEAIQPPDYATVKCHIDLAKIYLLMHMVEEKVEKLRNSPQISKILKRLEQYKRNMETAVKSDNIADQASTYNSLVKYSLKLDVKLCDQALLNFESTELRYRSKSAMDVSPPPIKEEESKRSSSACGVSKEVKGIEGCRAGSSGAFSIFSSDRSLSGRYGKQPPASETRSSSSQSSIFSSSLGSLSSPGLIPDEEQNELEDADGLPKILTPTPRKPGARQ